MKTSFVNTAIIVIAFFLHITISNAQNLYALSYNANWNYLSKVDPMTGAVTVISQNGLAQIVASGISSLDPVNKRFFFMSSGDSIITVDLITGNLLSKKKISVAGTYSIALTEFNFKDSTLYAISYKLAEQMFYFSKVDPASGNVTIISPVGLAHIINSGISSLDPINKRFFILSYGDTLTTIDLITGNPVSKNKISVSGTYLVGQIEFNCQDHILYAISKKISDNMFYLSKVDPNSGNVTIISTAGLTNIIYSGLSSLDPVNKRFFFMSYGDTLNTVDLITGNPISKNKISVSGILLVEYEKSCQLISTGIENQHEQIPEYTLFPNPFSFETTLISTIEFNQASLIIYNLMGQEVKQINNLSGQTIKLRKDNLPNGIYFIRLIQDNKIIYTNKLIITD